METINLEIAKTEEDDDDALPIRSPEEWARMKAYVDRWKVLGPLLEEQREEDVRRSDTKSNIASFGRLFPMAVAASTPSDTSGLVEQQRLFSILRLRA
jgi:hypothetical protein